MNVMPKITSNEKKKFLPLIFTIVSAKKAFYYTEIIIWFVLQHQMLFLQASINAKTILMIRLARNVPQTVKKNFGQGIKTNKNF